MKIYVYPADTFGCGYLRMIWPARALAGEGHDIVIVMPEGTTDAFGRPAPVSDLRGRVNAEGRTVNVTAPRDADVMVFQRISHQGLADAVPLWRASGIAVVIDVDDDLSCIHPSNPAWRSLHPTLGKPGFSWRVTEQACRDATLVTCSTPALMQRYASHGRGAVLYNCIPAKHLELSHTDSTVIGWGGTVASHPDDLQEVGSALARLTDSGERLRIVGPDSGVEKALRVRQNWSASGSVDIFQWPRQLASDIGIGIAPLADTRFNAAKSWLKPLEYASLGIPCVMSPRTEYRRLNKLGVGGLADKPRDWEKKLKALIASRDLRHELSEQGRFVALQMTIETNAWRWLEAWSEAKRIQEHSMARAN